MTMTGEAIAGAVILEVTQEASVIKVLEVMILVRVEVEAALEVHLYIHDHDQDQDQSQKVHTLLFGNLTPVRYLVHAHVPFPGLDQGHLLTRNRFLEVGVVA